VAIGEGRQDVERLVSMDGDRERVGHGGSVGLRGNGKFSLPASARAEAKDPALQKSGRI
jgi:hypothetical protein